MPPNSPEQMAWQLFPVSIKTILHIDRSPPFGYNEKKALHPLKKGNITPRPTGRGVFFTVRRQK